MSIFIVENDEATKSPVASKEELKWTRIGVDFRNAKKANPSLTSKKFSEDNNINYGTFTKQMHRYKAKIDLAIKIQDISKKPSSKMTRQDRALVMINSFRQSIRKNIATSKISGSSDKSVKWFNETIRQGVKGHKVSKPESGKLYAYNYDAKHKATLPYWDRYPLIVFLGFYTSPKGTLLMHGLNLHYVPPKARQQFLEELLKQYATTKTITNSTRLKIDWSKVKGFQGADKMIKAYLPSHIKGPIIEVKPSDWANVVMLPLQSFESKGSKYSAQKVWKK